ncbi:hypothetical protein HQ496_13660 [bacterium]|nr:hypothetical protein [bacterium]
MPDSKQSIILGGIVTGLLGTSYLGLINFICCMGVLIGAVVTVWHYTDTNELTITGGHGAKLGVSAALIGLAIAFVLNFILVKMGINHETAINDFIIAKLGDSMPPEQIEAMQAAGLKEKTILDYLQALGIGAVAYSAFGAIGGGIASKMFKKGGDEPSIEDSINDL